MNKNVYPAEGRRGREMVSDREVVRRELAKDIAALNRRMLADIKEGLLNAAGGTGYGKPRRRNAHKLCNNTIDNDE